MRVAFLVSSFPALSETFILDQIAGLIDRGCDVTIFAECSQRSGETETHPDVAAYQLEQRTVRLELPPLGLRPLQAGGVLLSRQDRKSSLIRCLNLFRYGARAASLRLFFDAANTARHAPFDVVHAHFGPNGIRALPLLESGALQGKLVTSFYGYDVSQYPKERGGNPYRALFRTGDRFLALSNRMRARLQELGCPDERLLVHPLGIDPAKFAGESTAGLPLTSDRGMFRVLTIGRFVEKKGILDGLKAFALFTRQLSPGARAEYLIVGDGLLRAQVERMISELGLEEGNPAGQVKLLGWKTRPEIANLLGECQVLLAPSRTASTGDEEGTPVVLMEASASALPVVSTRHAGIPETVEDGVTGFLVNQGDTAGLAAALSQLLKSPDLRTRMGLAGRERIMERHNIHTLNDQLLELYREVSERE
jgi:colanic acid/amylovoran biosynthesis glycosyltransferase